MAEFIDAILPCVLAISFTMAYYGSNAALMTNIGNDHFGGRTIEDVKHLYVVMLQMFAFDLFSMILSRLSLNFICGIDLFQVFCNIMKKYWIIFLLKLPAMSINFGAKDINFGFDYSGEYLGITDEGRLKVMQEAVGLSDEEKSFLLSNSTVWRHLLIQFNTRNNIHKFFGIP